MTTKKTTPATKEFCVWADCSRRVYQHVEAATPEEAYRIAKANPEDWEFCFEHESNGYRLSNEVQDPESEEFVRIDGNTHCKTCGSEIAETINDTCFRDGECGPCEYQRYRSQPVMLALAQALRQECANQVQHYLDGLKDDFGGPDDLQEKADHWKALRDQCDAAIANYGQAA
jgi:hypothetical protein